MNRPAPLFVVGMALFASLCPQSFALGKYVRTRSEQCLANGFSGACYSVRPTPDGIPFHERCDRLVCAEKMMAETMGGPTHEPIWSKPPDERTHSGRNHICLKGEPVEVAEEDMPLTGNLKIKVFRCTEKEPSIADKIEASQIQKQKPNNKKRRFQTKS